MQAVILVGGKGTRLAARLNGLPKPLIDVDGVPLLHRQLDELYAAGVRDSLMLAEHAVEHIRSFLAHYRHKDMVIRVLEDGEPQGSGGAVLKAWDALAAEFLVVYGDTLFHVDLGRFIGEHRRTGADATLFVHPNDHPHDSDLIETGTDRWVTGFHPYPHPSDRYFRNLVNAALYVVNKEALACVRHVGKSDFAKDLFPRMLAAGRRLRAYPSFEYIKDVGTPERLDKAVGHLRSGRVARSHYSVQQSAIFLDRDGTLNAEVGLVRDPEALRLLPMSAEAVRAINTSDYRAIVVTNQPVIARGEIDMTELDQIHAKLETELGQQRAFLDGIYYCPHHPDGGFPGEIAALKIACDCRKPAPGMLFQAAREFHLDLRTCWIVGDSGRDIMAGDGAGVTSVLVETGHAGEFSKYPMVPDFQFADVARAAHFILQVYPLLARHVVDLVGQIVPGTLVLIGGAARSGKSTLAGTLVRELRRKGMSAANLPLDGYLVPIAERRGRESALSRYRLGACLQDISLWLAGQALHFAPPVYDRNMLTPVKSLRSIDLPADGVLVIEGVPALAMECDGARPVVRITLETDESARRQRMDVRIRAHGELAAERIHADQEARDMDETALVSERASRADFRFRLDPLLAERK